MHSEGADLRAGGGVRACLSVFVRRAYVRAQGSHAGGGPPSFGPDVHFLWRLGRFLSFISLIFPLESGDISRNFFDGNGCNGCNGYGLSLSPPRPPAGVLAAQVDVR